MPMGAYLIDLAQCLRFYTRLPIPPLPHENEPHGVPDFTRIARAVPMAGAVIGLLGGLVLLFARGLGMSELPAAAFALAAIVIVTGAFHEDGLADSADSCGGANRERRLAIMTDSRIGAYGAIAIVLSLIVRTTVLGDIVRLGEAVACAALVGSGAVTRTAALWLSVSLPPAKTSGAAFIVGKPEPEHFVIGIVIATIVAGLVLWPTVGIIPYLAALLASAAVAAWAGRFARRHVEGYTGDLAGATQQLAEIAFLASVLIFAGAFRG